jgi:hypothetical protein
VTARGEGTRQAIVYKVACEALAYSSSRSSPTTTISIASQASYRGILFDIHKQTPKKRCQPRIPVLSAVAAGALFWTQGRTPRFEDYPSRYALHGAPVSPDTTSPDARRFLSALRRGVEKGPNFAGAYTVVIWGCGTSCQSGAVVDGRTGRVWPLPQDLARGAEFEVTSRLFVADPVKSRPQPYESAYVKYYEWRDSLFVFIDSVRAKASR